MTRPESTHKTAEVFGINRDLPLNYVTRSEVDGYFIENLTRDKHIVVYGSSKQGKTCLRKNCLNDEDYITVHCSNKWSLSDLHAAVLKRAGFEITQSNTKTESGKYKILASLKAAFFGNSASVTGSAETQTTDAVTTVPLELDPEDVNDIIKALKGLNRFIVLEDFHYLPIDTQKDFSVALKAFHEQSPLCFIIVGVWLEENRLTVYNGDLTGRIVSINADTWTTAELAEVIHTGEALLHVQFAEPFVKQLLRECFESVYIVQEACYQCCLGEEVFQTQDELKRIGENLDAKALVKQVVNQQTGRYNSFITQFASGFQDTTLQMYRWLLFPVLTADIEQLEHGLRLKRNSKILTSQSSGRQSPESRQPDAGPSSLRFPSSKERHQTNHLRL